MGVLRSVAIAISILSCGVCQAGFLAFPFTGTSSGLNTRTVQYTVWENETGIDADVPGTGLNVGAGQFAYLYQVVFPSLPSVNSFAVMADMSSVNSFGVLTDMVFSAPTEIITNSNSRTASVSDFDDSFVEFSITPAVGGKIGPVNAPSEIMYLISSNGPTFGKAEFSGGTPGLDSLTTVPVPVPVPAALGLFAIGIPFLNIIRRRIAK